MADADESTHKKMSPHTKNAQHYDTKHLIKMSYKIKRNYQPNQVVIILYIAERLSLNNVT